MSDLEGRVALVTGSGRNIGKMIAHVLGQQGMRVAISDVKSELVDSTVNEFAREGLDVKGYVADVSNKSQVTAMFDRVESELGPLWLLVNNAGVLNAAPTAEMPEELWDKAFAIDAKGVFLCSQAALRKMIPRRQGRIVNFASIAGIIVRTEQIAYCSAKAAVVHFSRCLAVEVAPHNITVNCLCPGMTGTDMLLDSAKERGLDLDAMVELIPDGRMAKAEDHAQLVAFFASEAAAHITGQVVAVDGGQSLYHPLMAKRIQS